MVAFQLLRAETASALQDTARRTSWTWIQGSPSLNDPGIYPPMNVDTAQGYPSARKEMATYYDVASGSLYVYGGYVGCTAPDICGAPAVEPYQFSNELWRLNTTSYRWTWITGNASIVTDNTNAIQGVESADFVPPKTVASGLFYDEQTRSVYLYGGTTTTGTSFAMVNTLWSFSLNTRLWTYVAGYTDAYPDQTATYPYSLNLEQDNTITPGAAISFGYFFDVSSRSFFVFGGFRRLYSNEVWRFRLESMLWSCLTSNEKKVVPPETYGIQGVESCDNVPGAREVTAGFYYDPVMRNFYVYGGPSNSMYIMVNNALWVTLYISFSHDLYNLSSRPHSSISRYLPCRPVALQFNLVVLDLAGWE